ncbi:MAG: hypothetical protein ABIN36_13825 [Ferruginibacter sp.]
MLKYVHIILMILLFGKSGQAQFSYQFEKIKLLDTIFDHDMIKKLRSGTAQYLSPDYFTVLRYKSWSGLMLMAKEKNYWLALSLPDDNDQDLRLQYNGSYFFYETHFTHGSRGVVGSYSNFNIIDPVNKESISLLSMLNLETYDTDSANSIPVKTSCRSKIIFENNESTVLSFGDIDECLTGGTYKIADHKLKLVKYYDEAHHRMADVRWAGDIATWMTLDELKRKYSDAGMVKTTDLYSSCAEDERTAYAIVGDKDTIAVVLVDIATETHVQKIIVFSQDILFGNISTALTARQILTLFPKATLDTDLLTEDEYIDLDDLKIRIVFRTTNQNRVGKYKDEKFTGLRRPSAKIDFIEVN